MDRELTRAELDELLPLYALDALDGEEREQVERCVASDEPARRDVTSLREAVSWLPSTDISAPETLWEGIEQALTASHVETPSPSPARSFDTERHRRRGLLGRQLVAALAAAAALLALVLGVQVVRQQHRIDDLAAEMHRNPIEQQANAALASASAHLIHLTTTDGHDGAEVVMLPDGTGYFMKHNLPKLSPGSTYQLWAKVGHAEDAQMVSLGVLGRAPGIAPFRLATTPTMLEVTKETASGSASPSNAVIVQGDLT
jgi:anti-sigma-K factor RskA